MAREIGGKPVQGCIRGSNGGSGKEDGVGVGVRTRRMRMHSRPESAAIRRSLVVFRAAFSVL